ncbi:MAG: type I methionyl aminopeptidase [Deltaproteobacteria bacterium]|nr:type I methionyl aminopeptidase [Deltaproteobacteria bacterium]
MVDDIKVGRNEPCPCGSGRKYKKCCLSKKGINLGKKRELSTDKFRIQLKNKDDVQGIREAGALTLEALDLAEVHLKPGIKTADIDKLIHEFIVKNNAIPAPLNYKGYPKSICVSINEVICHGIPGKRIIHEGDIVNIDITTILNGYYADASKTFFVGKPGPDAKKIVSVARECLKRGISMVQPGNTVGDIGWAIQTYAEGEGCSVVREFVGHGVGFKFHEPPQIPHYGKKGDGVKLVPGMVFTIEPMINLGERDLNILDDNWTAITSDGSLSAQFEQTLLVTDNGYESMTHYTL